MSNRAFFWAALLALVLGGALGGALILVLDGGEEEAPVVSPLAGPSGDVTGLERLGEIAGRTEAGDVDAEDMEELEEVVSGFAAGAEGVLPGDGDAPGDRMMGSVASLEGGVLAVDTPIGPLQVGIGAETNITVIGESEGDLEDLTPGLRVTLEGERNEEGVLETASVRVVPEGLDFALDAQPSIRQALGGMIGAASGLSEEELAALSMQAAVMAAQARAGGSGVTVETPEEGVTVITQTRPLVGGSAGDAPLGPPAGIAAIPGERRVFSFQVPGQAPGQAAGAAGRGLTGVLESVDGGVLELTTSRGSIRARVGQDTTVTVFSRREGGPEDLTQGALVMIAGQPGEAGALQASEVTVLPESLALPFGGPRTAP